LLESTVINPNIRTEIITRLNGLYQLNSVTMLNTEIFVDYPLACEFSFNPILSFDFFKLYYRIRQLSSNRFLFLNNLFFDKSLDNFSIINRSLHTPLQKRSVLFIESSETFLINKIRRFWLTKKFNGLKFFPPHQIFDIPPIVSYP
jgi:hypothetical protein